MISCSCTQKDNRDEQFIFSALTSARQVDGFGAALNVAAAADPVAAAGAIAPVAADAATGTLLDTSKVVADAAVSANALFKNATSNVLAVNTAVQDQVKLFLARLVQAADTLQASGQVVAAPGGAIAPPAAAAGVAVSASAAAPGATAAAGAGVTAAAGATTAAATTAKPAK